MVRGAVLAVFTLTFAGCLPTPVEGETTSTRTCPDGTPQCIPAACSVVSTGCGNFMQCHSCDGTEVGTGLVSVVLFDDPIRGLDVDDSRRVYMARGNRIAKHIAETPQTLWERTAEGVDEFRGLTVEPVGGTAWAWGDADGAPEAPLFTVGTNGGDPRLVEGCGEGCTIRYVKAKADLGTLVGGATMGTTTLLSRAADGSTSWRITAAPPGFITGAHFRKNGGVAALFVVLGEFAWQDRTFPEGASLALFDDLGKLVDILPLDEQAQDARILGSTTHGTLYVSTVRRFSGNAISISAAETVDWELRIPHDQARGRATVAPDGTVAFAFVDAETAIIHASIIDPFARARELGATGGSLGGQAQPTAVSFFGNDVLVAGSFRGRVDLWGVSTTSDDDNGFVVRIRP